MPWRALKGQAVDPYRVWLSEVMLQQTTVAAVGPYFLKFVKRWPSLGDLASAELDDVLRMWAGLGYYRRARLLHACAQTLRDAYGGVFPREEETLLRLPGFGPYTAAAVSAIAFGKRANVVDGNVERVMARIFRIEEPLPRAKTSLREAAASMLPEKRCGDYAQALMDLGATVCTPRSPKCGACPWAKICRAREDGVQETLPRRDKKKPKPVRRAMAFVLVDAKDRVLLRRRPESGLLAGMMEVPTSPWLEGPLPDLSVVRACAPARGRWTVCPGVVRHVFTHFTLELSVAVAAASRPMRGHWTALDRLGDEALPNLMKKVIVYAEKSF